MPSNSPAAAWLKSIYPSVNARAFVSRAYRSVFGGEHGQAVLADLSKACFGLDTTATRNKGQIDPYQMAVNEGRRQAYMHIAGILMVTGVDIKPEESSDYDHRDERRGRDGDDDDRPVPRYGAGWDPDLDGPIDAGSNSSGGSGSSSGGTDTGTTG